MKTITSTIVFATCLAASAADITLSKDSDYTVGFNDPTCWNPSGVPEPGNDYWLLSDSKIFYSRWKNEKDESFAGDSLNIGSPSSSSFGFKSGRLHLTTIAAKTVTLPNLVWWSGQINTGYNGTHLWYGTWTVRQADAGAYHRTGLNAAGHCYTNFVTLASSNDDADAANAVIEIGVGSSGGYPGSITYNTMSTGTQGHHHFRGDFSGYKGSFYVSAPYQPVVFFNGTIIGDPSVPNAAAVRLGTNACFAIGAKFAQNTSRGIQISGTQAYFMTWSHVANEWTLSYPVSGTGNVIKDGPGKVTLACAWTAGDITVKAGTLELTPEASFPAGQNVTVKNGAMLIINRADCWTGFNVTAESGSTVERNVIVGYNASTDAITTSASISADATPDADGKISIALTEAISLPFHSAKRLAVATLEAGATFTADDFKDSGKKTCGLPKTSFEVTGSTLYLVARPVAVSVRDFDNSNSTINGANSGVTTEYWSNGAVAQSGFDYLLTNAVGKIGTADFAGDSLTITGNKNTDSQNQISRLTATTLYPPVTIRANSAYYTVHKLAGDIAIAGEYGSSSAAVFRGVIGSGGTVPEGLDVTADITGDGVAILRGANVTAGMHRMGVHGDNSGYVGQIVVATENNGTVANRRLTTRLGFSAPENLGGEPDVFRYNAIKTQNHSFLYPEATMTLETTNRGIDISSGGFDVPEGVTFTVKAPIRQESSAYKLGGGVLALGGTICWGSDGATTKAGNGQRTVVEEGGIMAASDVGVKDMYLVMSNETAIVLSPGAGLTYGFTGTVMVPTGKVRIVLDSAYNGADVGFTAPICTVDDSTLANKFTLVRAKGLSATLKTETVTCGSVECTKYSVCYTPTGFVLVFR